jgi:hypothetical protein
MRKLLFALMLALPAAAAPSSQKPWLEMSGGPVVLHESGRSGLGTGPLLRLGIGYPLGERFAAELWFSGALENGPFGSAGDRALVGGGAGGRMLLRSFAEGKLGLWAHAGLGWAAPAAGGGRNGATGFAGAILAFQPFVKRFQIGLEADAVAYRSSWGVALLPSLRCSF